MAYLTAATVKERIGSKAQNWDEDRVASFVARFETVVEDQALGHAYYTLDEDDEYQPREHTETLRSRGWSDVLILSRRPVVAISALSVDGTALTEDEIDELDLDLEEGTIYDWSRCGTVVVTYTHGVGVPPPAILDGCVDYVKAKGWEESTDRNPAIEAYEDSSGNSYRIGRADPSIGAWTGIRPVDDAINEIRGSGLPGMA